MKRTHDNGFVLEISDVIALKIGITSEVKKLQELTPDEGGSAWMIDYAARLEAILRLLEIMFHPSAVGVIQMPFSEHYDMSKLDDVLGH